MQSKLFLLALSSLSIISGNSQVRQQANLLSSTNSLRCTSTSTTTASCTSTSSSSPDAQSSPSLAPDKFPWRDRTQSGSSTNSDRSTDSTAQDERIDGSSGKTSSSDQSSPSSPNEESNSSTSGSDRSIADIEQQVHQQINQYRAEKKLPVLTLNESISEQARKHSQDMASGAVVFGHDGFTERARAIANVITYSKTAENVAYNKGYADVAKQAVQGWLSSTGHRQNIDGEYNLTGIGVAKNAKGEYYFTQIFIRN